MRDHLTCSWCIIHLCAYYAFLWENWESMKGQLVSTSIGYFGLFNFNYYFWVSVLCRVSKAQDSCSGVMCIAQQGLCCPHRGGCVGQPMLPCPAWMMKQLPQGAIPHLWMFMDSHSVSGKHRHPLLKWRGLDCSGCSVGGVHCCCFPGVVAKHSKSKSWKAQALLGPWGMGESGMEQSH